MTKQKPSQQDPMECAFALAEEALAAGEVPIGCVATFKGSIVASGRNEVNCTKNATNHAELLTIRRLEDWCQKNDLEFGKVIASTTFYITVEPCIMCTAAFRFSLPSPPLSIIFGASNERFGGCGSVISLHNTEADYQRHLDLTRGVQESRAIELLKRFYCQENPNAPDELRKDKSLRKQPPSMSTVGV